MIALVPLIAALGLYAFWTMIPETKRSPYRSVGSKRAHSLTARRGGRAVTPPRDGSLNAATVEGAASLWQLKRR